MTTVRFNIKIKACRDRQKKAKQTRQQIPGMILFLTLCVSLYVTIKLVVVWNVSSKAGTPEYVNGVL